MFTLLRWARSSSDRHRPSCSWWNCARSFDWNPQEVFNLSLQLTLYISFGYRGIAWPLAVEVVSDRSMASRHARRTYPAPRAPLVSICAKHYFGVNAPGGQRWRVRLTLIDSSRHLWLPSWNVSLAVLRSVRFGAVIVH